MHYYIGYLVGNTNTYRRGLNYSTMIGILAFSMFLLILCNKKELYSINGDVQSINKTQISVRSHNRYDLVPQYHFKNVIEIQINYTSYYVTSNFKERWHDVLKNVHIGDSIVIDYIFTKEGNNICQLEKNSSILLDYNELESLSFIFQAIILCVSILLFTYAIFLVVNRRKYKKKYKINQHFSEMPEH